MSDYTAKSYYKNSQDEWVECTQGIQCPHNAYIFPDVKCQGLFEHEGPHWAYDKNGALLQSFNDSCRPHPECASSMTPPGHKDYIEPKELYPQAYNNHWSHKTVTDKDLIERLNSRTTDLNIKRL